MIPDNVSDDVNDIVEMIINRVKYGSPPLFFVGIPGVGGAPTSQTYLREMRIKRRRQMLGLPYQTYVPPHLRK